MNSGYLIGRGGTVEELPLATKTDFSERIFDAVASLLKKPRT